ncbi:hypothetical protein UR09_00820 [Candidatus Nitromaritima sp. SCGC AAA799-A02]|nr:hypothetical protein UR09_00820 [Candidatus Nitromaritima sp. SCGC AAA799-A02]
MTEFIREFSILSRLRWAGVRNDVTRLTSDKVFRWSMIFVMGALFVAGDYVFFHRIIRYLDGLPLQVGEELIVQLINVVFLTFLVMVLFSSLIVSLSVFYLSADLEMLHSMPLSPTSVMIVRFIQSVVNSSWMMLLFAIPVFAAYGKYFDVSFGYYFFLGAALIPFVFIPCAVGSLGIMALIRYFPTRRAHQVLSFLGLVFLAGIVVYLRFLSPEKFFGKEVSDEMIMAFVESLRVPDFPFLPSSWITLGLTRWVEADSAAAWGQLAYLYSAAGILVAALWIVGNRIYFTGWRLMQQVRSAPPENNETDERKSSLMERLPLSPSQRALWVKDFRVFFRDPEQWSQMFILCALVIVYIFNIMNLPLSNRVLKNVVSVLNVGLVGFVLSALISRFVFSATSIEGRRIWSIYTAPVRMEQFLWGKFWMFFPPLLVIAEFLVVVSNYLLQVDAFVMRASILGVFMITLALVGLGLGLGAMYPMFQYENVSEIATSTGGILFMILSLSYIGLFVALGARPMYVHFNQAFLMKNVGSIDVPICYALMVLLTLIVAIVPFRKGISALKAMDI